MPLSLHNLKAPKSTGKSKRRVGRGNASGTGTYSGRGQKGQRSRSGGKGGLKRAGLKAMLSNKPKIGGFKSLSPKLITANIGQLEAIFESGESVNAKTLIAKNVIKTHKPGLKILGNGKLTKKLNITADAFSESAKKAILEAGGTAEIRNPKAKK